MRFFNQRLKKMQNAKGKMQNCGRDLFSTYNKLFAAEKKLRNFKFHQS